MDRKSSFRLEEQLLQDPSTNKNSLIKSRPTTKRKRFQTIIKNFIGRGKQTTESSLNDSNNGTVAMTNNSDHSNVNRIENTLDKTIEQQQQDIFENNGSNIQLCDNKKITNSTLSLDAVQQKLWSVVPLLKRENSSGNLGLNGKSNSVVKYNSMRKCETVLALSRQFSTYSYIPEEIQIETRQKSGNFYKRSISLNVPEIKYFNNNIEPIRPLNRLRSTKSIKSNTNCSRCSSILSESRSSLKNVLEEEKFVENQQCNSSSSSSNDRARLSLYESSNRINYIPRNDSDEIRPLSKIIQKSNINLNEIEEVDGKTENIHNGVFTCKLCLIETNIETNATTLNHCKCIFCTECMKCYVEFEIKEGAYEISCPDAQCPAEGILILSEISSLVSPDLMEKHHKYRFNREVELDKSKTWCPRAGCETVCLINPQSILSSTNGNPNKITNDESSTSTKDDKSIETSISYAVQCPTCHDEFCPECRKPWHENLSCEQYRKQLVEEGLLDDISDFPYQNDSIKLCPMCGVPIEKDSGCAQMMCKRCKHVFCWYCLASLDDDFLLRHYDTGPCKNKLGHSRASVIWHRAQVIGIFAGFGILLVIASPLLLLAVPCILCCKCQPCCGGKTKTVETNEDFDEIQLER